MYFQEVNKNDDEDDGRSSPVVIKVQGLFMDTSSAEYEIVTDMGNNNSQEENNTEGQLDPLTDAKNAKNRKNSDAEDVKEEEELEVVDETDGAKENTNTDSTNENDKAIGTVNNNQNKDSSKEEVTGGSNAKAADGKDNGKKADEDIVVLVAGKDDVDAASTYSLFMEKDFRYYFQHPYCRCIISYFVVFCNFLIYAEDPVAHSRKECLIPMIGNDIAFVMTRYPPNAWSLLKVVFWIIGIIVGMFVGKLLVHGLLFSKYIL